MSEIAAIRPLVPNWVAMTGVKGRIIVLGSMEFPTRLDSHTFGGGLHDAHSADDRLELSLSQSEWGVT